MPDQIAERSLCFAAHLPGQITDHIDHHRLERADVGGGLLEIVFGERGTLALVEATADAYREVATADVFDEKTWTMPTLSDGVLYLRTEKQLVALDLRP